MKKRSLKRLVPSLLTTITILVLFVLFFLSAHLNKILRKLDYFKIKDIIVRAQGAPGDFAYLKGSNIFAVDLRKESGHILELYPDFKNVRLIRILPDKLFVDFTRRKPVAYVKLHRYCLVDEEFSLFDLPPAEPLFDLPLILGLEKRIFGLRQGKRYNIPELSLALTIIKEKNLNPRLNEYKIRRIDVAGLESASFFINYRAGEAKMPDLEIKTGQDNIKEKMNILAGVFRQVGNRAGNIKYIDLRFKEPAIKLRDAK
jgi:cell division septal protein FtsQ